MNRIFLIIFLFPYHIYASFPVDNISSDTIRKNGKIYLLIEGEKSKKIQEKSFNDIDIRDAKTSSKKVMSKRSKNILRGIGFALIILSILVIILFVLVVGWLRRSFSSTGLSS